MKDRLHQPKRAELIPGLMQVIEGANAAGASGAALSGAGPTVIALIPRSDEILSKRVSYAMEFAFRHAGVEARTLTLDIDMRGACVRRKS
jgi:homoserine kinase